MRFAVSLLGFGLAAASIAQMPNVLVTLDARLSFRKDAKEDNDVMAYDLKGRHSIVTLQFSLEPGFDVILSERFQRIEGDADSEQLDEYYIEDRGYWRVGKQYLPFGRNTIFRESAYAGRVNISVSERAIPLALCYADGGPKRPIGFVARLGDRLGISVAIGDRFGQSATSLTPIRRPEDSLGSGHGYERAYGIDFHIGLQKNLTFELDHVSFRHGETNLDRSLDVTDASVVWRPDRHKRLEGAYTREWKSQDEFIRLTGEYPVYDGMSIEPFVRYRNGKFYDAAFTLRIRP